MPRHDPQQIRSSFFFTFLPMQQAQQWGMQLYQEPRPSSSCLLRYLLKLYQQFVHTQLWVALPALRDLNQISLAYTSGLSLFAPAWWFRSTACPSISRIAVLGYARSPADSWLAHCYHEKSARPWLVESLRQLRARLSPSRLLPRSQLRSPLLANLP